MNPATPKKQPARGNPAQRGAPLGTKLLIGAVSFAATVGGWAYIALVNPAPTQVAQASSSVNVVQSNGSSVVVTVPTVEPLVGINDLPAQQTQVQMQAPAVSRPLRTVNIPRGPMAMSRSSR